MKTTFIVLALFISISAISQSATKKEIKTFCNEFSTVIVKGDMIKAMDFVNKDYVAIQHDKFLEGRTDQFFSELLAGVDNKGEFTTVSIKEIKSMKTSKIKFMEDSEAEITFIISLKNGNKIKTKMMLNIESKDSMAFLGSVG